MNLLNYYIQGITTLDILSWTGPLWFAVELLIFTMCYVLLRNFHLGLNIDSRITAKNILVLTSLIALIAFAIRLFFPIDSAVMNIQLSYMSGYAVMFAVGVLAYQKNLLEKIDYGTGRKWLFWSIVLGVPIWLAIMLLSGVQNGTGFYKGGWNLPAFAYAYWESFFCVSFCIELIGIFKQKFNSQDAFQKFLSDNAFGVFVFHAPIVVGVSILLRGVVLHPITKFVVVSLLAVAVTFIFVAIIRRISLFRRIFS